MEGFEGWKAKGASVFRLTKPDRRGKPRAHRFAVYPPNGFRGRCNPLKVGKFYTHVYQTKVQVGRELRTLHSKRMAKELQSLCGNSYHPRKFDLEEFKSPVNSSGRGATIGTSINIPKPFHNFQPLSKIQGIPPYVHFINPSNNQSFQYSNHNYQPHVFNRPSQQQVINDGDNPNNNKPANNISSGYQQTVFNQGNVQPPVTYFLPPQQVNLQNQARFFQ